MIHLLFTFLCESDNLRHPKCFTDYETVHISERKVVKKDKFVFTWCSDFTVQSCEPRAIVGCEITYKNGDAEEVVVSNKNCKDL